MYTGGPYIAGERLVELQNVFGKAVGLGAKGAGVHFFCARHLSGFPARRGETKIGAIG